MTFHFAPTRWISLLAVAVWATSCTVSAPPSRFPEITFSHLPPIRLNVAEVEVVEKYASPLRAPNVEHEFPVVPMAAMRRWAVDRIQAAGETRQGRIIIDDASAIAVPLPVHKGLRGLAVKEQFVRYDVTLAVTVEVRSDRGYRDSYATARVEHSQTAPEDITLAERDKIFFKLTEQLMKDLNSELELNIRRHMQRDLL